MPTFHMPLPPSVNSMYVNVPGKGRVKSKAYKAWLDIAGWQLKAQRINKTSGPVLISLIMKKPRANADADNRIKACQDILVSLNIIDDDKNVQAVAAAWGNVQDCECTVTSCQPGSWIWQEQ